MAPTTLFGAIPVAGRSRWYQFRSVYQQKELYFEINEEPDRLIA